MYEIIIRMHPYVSLAWDQKSQSTSHHVHAVTFLFFFYSVLCDIFYYKRGTGLCLGVGLGFQYADTEVTDFLLLERKSSSSNNVAPVCLHP